MKYVFHIICLLILSVLQPIIPPYCFGIGPNLFLLYTLLVCCYCKKTEGLILGACFGLILDLINGRWIGLNLILMLATAFLINGFFANVIRNNTLLITMLLSVVVTFLYETLYYLVAFFDDLHFGSVLLRVLLPECLSAAIAAIPMYFIIKKFAKTLWDDKGEGIG